MIISGIATVYNLEALNFAADFLKDPETKPEAEIAVLDIIENAGWDFPERSLEVLTKIIEDPTLENVKLRAEETKQEILNDI